MEGTSAINSNAVLLLPFNSACSARSVLNSINETSKFERIAIDMEVGEIEIESVGVEMKDVIAANSNTVLFLGGHQHAMETKRMLQNITQRVC